ncbi:UDP-2,3-diacylglucosamine diphosphatase [Acinetobacter towneri]|uniref:UDP-2,3-diacylglucosamine hydrolase n=1 Tax=Acinetobacter towneri TaxID=202956 RepID=A0ABX7T9W8_9GAMM|nr:MULTISPECIES: UDP-2,3-diacylglucosamine diphosphatase [Acinetobacter]MCA4798167.1 UDP-2,3-diacylglucosamine diphosphatase [Acinetobacter towneri]PCN61756.1 UDP-2,3-diacylglucosamine diphosphatase [Acinetobacter sp. YT-02]QTD58543.1 UDP-2,3-diacylglucosamine diphosphatase [Acinetobacter towneri]QTD60647.1 UDP-2,3-diacylglucosamine diphosphatase [Acinetobacter towneri]WOE30009.1 UDP-2,3-diacylglucosamine diphosphatase [Acinetobacter towneri]
MTYLFIADLHLSPNHPRLVRGFLDLLDAYQNKNTQLYILGDWFNAWIGDDYTAAWLDEVVARLKQFSQAGNQIYFIVGNRDFALGQKFLDQFSGQLLPDVYTLHIGSQQVRLEHGDALCTDDVSYQKFRKIIRNPIILGILKKTPLAFRQKLAQGFRKKSQQANQVKSYDVMDVNADAVSQALQHADVLIHGHTHRPNIHNEHGKPRIVLGDWRADAAQILVVEPNQALATWQLSHWNY